MARSWFRRRRRAAEHTGHGDPDSGRVERANLDGAEHAWWATAELERAWRPRPPHTDPPPEEERREILAEHFGDDWRTSFGFSEPTSAEQEAKAAVEERAIDDQDPYEVLQVDPSASWEEIVAAHRHQARAHHPDRLLGVPTEEQAEGEERIRVVNAAYQELKVRRGKQ